jgi:hypothetical protein
MINAFPGNPTSVPTPDATSTPTAPPAEPQYASVFDPLRSYYYRLTYVSVDPYPHIEPALYLQVKTATLHWMIAIP